MKIGIVSDIHGELKPLKNAVSLFKSQSINQIICAGDIVDGGLEGDAVIDYIRSQNILSVQGNHDMDAFADESWLSEELWAAEESLSDDLDDLISSYRGEYIRALPLIRYFTWEGLRICLTHGAPWSNTDHVFPTVSADICRKIFEASNADIVILGHTHIPMKLQFRDKWILNSGALCGNRDNLKRTCGIPHLPQVQFELLDTDTGNTVELASINVER